MVIVTMFDFDFLYLQVLLMMIAEKNVYMQVCVTSSELKPWDGKKFYVKQILKNNL